MKNPQIGITIIEDNVEIGANTCVDRATMGATVVHKGAKLDNLIQLAHNVEVGSHTVMASQVGVAGCKNRRMVYVRRTSWSCRTHKSR